MNAFANAVKNVANKTTTTNGMGAFKSTNNACLDLFYNIGASRGKDIIPSFKLAYQENPELATRIALWARDIRGGSGERKLFRDIFNYLEKVNEDYALRVLNKIPEIGRWDDVLVATNPLIVNKAIDMVQEALEKGNGLCAKWMPRKGKEAVMLRSYLGMTPKQYRKTLVNLTKVVEQQMCANQWDSIDFNKIPSVASSRYKKAFKRHTDKYEQWTNALAKNDGSAKVNAGAIYPYQVIQQLMQHGYTRYSVSDAEKDHIKAQWDALPNFIGNGNVLPVVDVSGSMTVPAGADSKSKVTCLDVAVSLGLYFADKNTGAFKDIFVNFSSRPQIQHLRGDIVSKLETMVRSHWETSTDFEAVMKLLLNTAKAGNVPQEDMPKTVVIFSDMQFNSAVRGTNASATRLVKEMYESAGYNYPNVVFWNINSSGNTPATQHESGVALVSGFSPAIAKCILEGDISSITPEGIMLKAISNERYNF